MRSAITLALVLCIAPACQLLVPATAGAMAANSTNEDSTYVVQVRVGVDVAWASTKATLSHLSLKPIDTDDAARTAIAEIDNSKATVTVETYDLDQSVIKISATKFAFGDSATASMVKDRIISDLDHKR
jgi:hypothetical protein